MNSITLSNVSLYPQPARVVFDIAAELKFDGLEIMVTRDKESQDFSLLAELIQTYQLPILSLHSPCLLFSQLIWDHNPLTRLAKTVEMADFLRVPTIVVHPPFIWQRKYKHQFANLIHHFHHIYPQIKICVENMFPWRYDWLLRNPAYSARKYQANKKIGKSLHMYAPTFNPAEQNYPYLTLDTSHCMTAGMDILQLAHSMSSRLAHIHLSDGTGSADDEHLPLGEGTANLTALFPYLRKIQYQGDIVLEINTHKESLLHKRIEIIGRGLDYITQHLETFPPKIFSMEESTHNPK